MPDLNFKFWMVPTLLSFSNQLNWEIEIYLFIWTSVSSVVEFERWWVLKSKGFGQESTYHQGKIFRFYHKGGLFSEKFKEVI